MLESNHLEWLHAGPEFTAFSRKDGSTSSSVESYANSWPPEIHLSPRISYSHEHILEEYLVPKSASQGYLTWLLCYTEITHFVTHIARRSNRRIQTSVIVLLAVILNLNWARNTYCLKLPQLMLASSPSSLLEAQRCGTWREHLKWSSVTAPHCPGAPHWQMHNEHTLSTRPASWGGRDSEVGTCHKWLTDRQHWRSSDNTQWCSNGSLKL